MNLFLLQQYQFIKKLYKNNNYLDILLNIDDFFDILNVYAYPNWLEAEIVNVKFMKYFTNIIIKTPYKKAPNPKAGVLLSKYGCKVEYKESEEFVPKEYKDENDVFVDPKTGQTKPKIIKEKIWLVDIMIPNKLIINDNIYDLESIQKKLDEEDGLETNQESVVSNGDEI